MSYFYSHLVEIESVTISLEELELNEKQKKDLAVLIDSTIHQTVLDAIMSKLSDADKLAFAEKVKVNPKDSRIMEFVNGKIDNIEEEIKLSVEQLKEELHKDINEAKRISKK